MTLRYRTDGPWGSGLGVNLTAAQVDENFYTLAEQIVALGSPAPGVGIAQIDVTPGGEMLITMSDASTFGPFQLPVAAFAWRGEWTAGEDYEPYDVFQLDGSVYLVLQAHTAPTEFDPDEENTVGPLLALMFAVDTAAPVVVKELTATHVFDASDVGAYLRFDSASGVLLSIPLEADVPEGISVGSTVSARQVGAGQIAVDPLDTAIIINTPETLLTRKTGSTITLVYIGGDEWDLAGDLELL
jgi:hypothetical protein